MSNNNYHLAQLNIARMRAPLTDPIMAGFVNQLVPLNRLGEQTEGFVWRLQTESGDATEIEAFQDPTLIINLTVWESLESLQAYVYRSDHTAAYRSRREWFEPLGRPSFVLWWIEAGHIPSLDEAKQRLEMLTEHGPGPLAFTFKNSFPAPLVESLEAIAAD